MRTILGLLAAVTMVLCSSAFAISQADWVNQVRQQVGSKLCKIYYANPQTATLMRQHHINLVKCQRAITTVFQRCANTYMTSMPAQINGQSGKYWGERLGVCTAAGFQDEFMAATINKNTLRKRLSQLNIKQFCASEYFSPVLVSRHMTQAQCIQSMTMNKPACVTQTLNSLPRMIKPYKAANTFMQCLINKL